MLQAFADAAGKAAWARESARGERPGPVPGPKLDQQYCLAMIEEMAQRLFPNGIITGRVRDDELIGAGEPARRYLGVPAESWTTVTDWNTLAATVRQDGPGMAAFAVIGRPNQIGHAIALVHTHDQNLYLIDPTTPDGDKYYDLFRVDPTATGGEYVLTAVPQPSLTRAPGDDTNHPHHPNTLDRLTQRLGVPIQTRVLVINPEGRPLTPSHADTGSIVGVLTDPTLPRFGAGVTTWTTAPSPPPNRATEQDLEDAAHAAETDGVTNRDVFTGGLRDKNWKFNYRQAASVWTRVRKSRRAAAVAVGPLTGQPYTDPGGVTGAAGSSAAGGVRGLVGGGEVGNPTDPTVPAEPVDLGGVAESFERMPTPSSRSGDGGITRPGWTFEPAAGWGEAPSPVRPWGTPPVGAGPRPGPSTRPRVAAGPSTDQQVEQTAGEGELVSTGRNKGERARLVRQILGGSDWLTRAVRELPGMAQALLSIGDYGRLSKLIEQLRTVDGQKLLGVLVAEKANLPKTPRTYFNIFGLLPRLGTLPVELIIEIVRIKHLDELRDELLAAYTERAGVDSEVSDDQLLDWSSRPPEVERYLQRENKDLRSDRNDPAGAYAFLTDIDIVCGTRITFHYEKTLDSIHAHLPIRREMHRPPTEHGSPSVLYWRIRTVCEAVERARKKGFDLPDLEIWTTKYTRSAKIKASPAGDPYISYATPGLPFISAYGNEIVIGDEFDSFWSYYDSVDPSRFAACRVPRRSIEVGMMLHIFGCMIADQTRHIDHFDELKEPVNIEWVRKVSEYATEGPKRFVGEYFVGLVVDRDYRGELDKLYERGELGEPGDVVAAYLEKLYYDLGGRHSEPKVESPRMSQYESDRDFLKSLNKDFLEALRKLISEYPSPGVSRNHLRGLKIFRSLLDEEVDMHLGWLGAGFMETRPGGIPHYVAVERELVDLRTRMATDQVRAQDMSGETIRRWRSHLSHLSDRQLGVLLAQLRSEDSQHISGGTGSEHPTEVRDAAGPGGVGDEGPVADLQAAASDVADVGVLTDSFRQMSTPSSRSGDGGVSRPGSAFAPGTGWETALSVAWPWSTPPAGAGAGGFPHRAQDEQVSGFSEGVVDPVGRALVDLGLVRCPAWGGRVEDSFSVALVEAVGAVAVVAALAGVFGQDAALVEVFGADGMGGAVRRGLAQWLGWGRVRARFDALVRGLPGRLELRMRLEERDFVARRYGGYDALVERFGRENGEAIGQQADRFLDRVSLAPGGESDEDAKAREARERDELARQRAAITGEEFDHLVLVRKLNYGESPEQARASVAAHLTRDYRARLIRRIAGEQADRFLEGFSLTDDERDQLAIQRAGISPEGFNRLVDRAFRLNSVTWDEARVLIAAQLTREHRDRLAGNLAGEPVTDAEWDQIAAAGSGAGSADSGVDGVGRVLVPALAAGLFDLAITVIDDTGHAGEPIGDGTTAIILTRDGTGRWGATESLHARQARTTAAVPVAAGGGGGQQVPVRRQDGHQGVVAPRKSKRARSGAAPVIGPDFKYLADQGGLQAWDVGAGGDCFYHALSRTLDDDAQGPGLGELLAQRGLQVSPGDDLVPVLRDLLATHLADHRADYDAQIQWPRAQDRADEQIRAEREQLWGEVTAEFGDDLELEKARQEHERRWKERNPYPDDYRNQLIALYFSQPLTPADWDQIEGQIRTRGSWNHAAGDITPALAADLLGLRINRVDPHLSDPYPIGDGSREIFLVRVHDSHWLATSRPPNPARRRRTQPPDHPPADSSGPDAPNGPGHHPQIFKADTTNSMVAGAPAVIKHRKDQILRNRQANGEPTAPAALQTAYANDPALQNLHTWNTPTRSGPHTTAPKTPVTWLVSRRSGTDINGKPVENPACVSVTVLIL